MAKLQPHEVDERAANAIDLINSSFFQSVLDDLHSECVQDLLSAQVGDLTAAAAHGRMKGIEAIRNKLNSYIADQKIQQSKGRR